MDAILDVSEEIDYLPEIGRPAKAIKILMDAVGICRGSYNPHYVSSELSQLRQDLFDFKQQAQPLGNASLDMLKKKKQIEDSIHTCEEELKKDKACLKNIQRIVNERKSMTDEYFRLTHRLAKAHQTKPQGKTLQQSINQKDQVLYLWTYLFGLDSMKEILQETIQMVQRPIPVQVDGNLIMSQYAKAKNIDACLKGCGAIDTPVKEEDFDVFELE